METTIIKQDEAEMAVREVQIQDDMLITLQKIDSASSYDEEQNWETPIPCDMLPPLKITALKQLTYRNQLIRNF